MTPKQFVIVMYLATLLFVSAGFYLMAVFCVILAVTFWPKRIPPQLANPGENWQIRKCPFCGFRFERQAKGHDECPSCNWGERSF